MDFEPISPKWNRVDTFIYKIEKMIKALIEQWKETRDPEPDVEEMIAAETKHLKEENEEYKKMLYPADLIIREEKAYCPRCNGEISETFHDKCCPECGQRLKKRFLLK